MKPDFTKPQSEQTIRDFVNNLTKHDWYNISKFQQLSEPFIREFKYKVFWPYISEYQPVSEPFIREFHDKVHWYYIAHNQPLSEDFIKEFKNKVNWNCICRYQHLSESFIREFNYKLNWHYISKHQNLSEDFMREFQGKIFMHILPNRIDNRSDEEKLEEIKEYAQTYNLEFKDGYLYAFRNHKNNRGMYNGFYPEKGIYKDWKCDLNPNIKRSYGFGILPQGNTPVKVYYKWWGTKINNLNVARVWAFDII
jgi:hypothetical protein